MRAWFACFLAGFLILGSAGLAMPGESRAGNQPPVVVATTPLAGDKAVDPNLNEIKITFSKPMQVNGWSLVMQDKNSFPEINGKVGFKDDGRTFVAPVKLKPGKEYVIWINSDRFKNFRDQGGRPALPYQLSFRTKP
jgi:hypothetical protein